MTIQTQHTDLASLHEVCAAQTARKKSVYRYGLFASLSASLRVAGRQLPGSLSARHFTPFEHLAASQRPPHSARFTIAASAMSPPLKLPTIPGTMLRMTSIGLSVDCTVCGAAIQLTICQSDRNANAGKPMAGVGVL